MHPHRPKLAEVLAREIRDGIAAQKWTDWLPQERLFADELKVSRSTLRQALNRLESDGLIERLHSKGNRIRMRSFPRGKSAAASPLVINLVVPGMSHGVRPAAAQWVEELQAQLAGGGGHLRILAAKACYVQRPERALAELVRRNPADCWVFRLSTLAMQRWLAERQVPAVIAGTCHPGVNLPFLDIDHRAMSRHATAAVLAAGHRRVALLVERDQKAGDVESERGFTEAVAAHPGAQAVVARYQEGVDGFLRQLDGLLQRSRSPTALVVTQAVYCFTVWSYLGSRGLCIPRDVSVIASVGGSDLQYLVPPPAYYRVNRKAYVQRIFRLIDARISGDPPPRPVLIIPEFVTGGSVGRPRELGG